MCSGGSSESTISRIAATVAVVASPAFSGLNDARTAWRTASYSAIGAAALVEDLNPMLKLPGSMTVTLIPKPAISPARASLSASTANFVATSPPRAAAFRARIAAIDVIAYG